MSRNSQGPCKYPWVLTMPNFVGFQNVVEKEFMHITYTSAVALLQKAKKTFEFPVSALVTLSPPITLR
jgi:hypothetical protein